MSKREAGTGARGRGRGRGGATGPKRAKKLPVRDNLLLLLDVGSSALALESDGKTSFDTSKSVADWILSRKIFAGSDSLSNLGFFPAPAEPGSFDDVYCDTLFVHDMFIKPNVAMLKRILELKTEPKNGNFVSALQGAIELIQAAKSNEYDDRFQIAVLSNFTGLTDKVGQDSLQALVDELNGRNISLTFIGDNSVSKSDAPEAAAEALEFLKAHCDCVAEPFETALNKLSFFAEKPKMIRGAPFSFEIAKDLKLELQMYVKNQEERIKFTDFKQYTADDTEIVKVRQLEEVGEEVKEEVLRPTGDEEGDKVAEEGTQASTAAATQVLNKADVIKGYRYGSSIIPFSDADREFCSVKKEKQLKLVQFTSRDNILPQFIMNECRYLVPNEKHPGAVEAVTAIVQAMLKQNVVAIARYGYNVLSNPRLVVLIPKVSNKTGCPILQHFLLPFNEDFRYFNFPDLDQMETEPNDFQYDAMDAYIDQFLLTADTKAETGEPKTVDLCKSKDIRNPRRQLYAMSLRRKALGQSTDLSEEEQKALVAMMATPRNLLENADQVLEMLTQSFELHRLDPEELRKQNVGFNNLSYTELNGFVKPENYDEMKLEEDDY